MATWIVNAVSSTIKLRYLMMMLQGLQMQIELQLSIVQHRL